MERPIFISEVTISATDDSESGRAIQKELTRNLYRIWFSHPSVAGITWWNMVDGGAVAGEPSYSGIFDADMNPKPSYKVLDELINNEWTTRLTAQVAADGKLSFRGFRGSYKLTYTNRKGQRITKNYKLQ